MVSVKPLRTSAATAPTARGPAPRLTREQSRSQTRERLVEAARTLLAQAGYHGVSVDQIAAQAGYTKGAFYANFDSKERIFLELLARHMKREAEELTRLVEAEASAESILGSLDQWLETLNADGDWALVSIELGLHARRSPTFASDHRTLHAAHQRRLGALVRTLFARAGRRLPVPSEDIAAGLMALAHGMVLEGAPRAGQPSRPGRLLGVVLRSLLEAAPSSVNR